MNSKEHFKMPFEQTIFNWCEKNNVEDIRFYPWDGNHISLVWPVYNLNTAKDSLLYSIQIDTPKFYYDKDLKKAMPNSILYISVMIHTHHDSSDGLKINGAKIGEVEIDDVLKLKDLLDQAKTKAIQFSLDDLIDFKDWNGWPDIAWKLA